MIAPNTAIQSAAIAEVQRIEVAPTLSPEDYRAYGDLLDLAIYPPDIAERIIGEDDPRWRTR